MVTTADDEMHTKAVKYGNLVSPLVKATQELYGMCQMSKEQMASIDNRLKEVERKVASLESKDQTQDAQIAELKKQNAELKQQLEEIKKLIKK
jgi:predicted RNase H-like nuclease (RuvC/YqgF family)